MGFSYGLLTAREAHDWFLKMMGEHEEFEVETDPLMAAIGSPIRVTVPASST